MSGFIRGTSGGSVSITNVTNTTNQTVNQTTAPIEYQYTLTVTGSLWTTTRAVGYVYKCAGGEYRMAFNIQGTLADKMTDVLIVVTGASFSSSVNQSLSCWGLDTDGSRKLPYEAITISPSFISMSFSGIVNKVGISGDIELVSKPTFATNTL